MVEISVGSRTDPKVVKRTRAILTSLGKVPVVCSASPGHIVPRVQALAMNEAVRLVQEGVASAEDVDTAVRVASACALRARSSGIYRLGRKPYFCIAHPATCRARSTPNGFRAPIIIESNMRSGRNGVRDREGFYDYKEMDVDAYRGERLERFVRLVQHLSLLPPGLGQT